MHTLYFLKENQHNKVDKVLRLFFLLEPKTDLFGNPLPGEDLEQDYDVDSAIYTNNGKPAQALNDPDTTTTPTTTSTPKPTTTPATTTASTTTATTAATTTTTQPRTAPTTTDQPIELTIPELDVVAQVKDGRIEAKVSWRISGSTREWTLFWGHEVCHVTSPSDSECTLAQETYAATIVRESTQVRYVYHMCHRHITAVDRRHLHVCLPAICIQRVRCMHTSGKQTLTAPITPPGGQARGRLMLVTWMILKIDMEHYINRYLHISAIDV